MKVLVLTTSISPFVLNPIKFLRKNIEVDIAYLNFKNWIRFSKNIGELNNIKCFNIPSFPMLGNQKNLKEFQTNINEIIIELILSYKIDDYDIIHGHFLSPSCQILYKIGKKYDIKSIVTGHGSDVYQVPFQTSGWLQSTKKYIRNVNKIITVCNYNKDILVNNNIVQPNKISVIYNGFDPEIFNLNGPKFNIESLGIDKKKKKLLTAGRFSSEKGHLELIRAMQVLSDHHLIIVGRGPLKRKYLKEITRLGLERRITLLDWMDSQTLSNILRRTDFFVLPSLREGFPAIVPEAIACGAYVITTDVGGISEIISDGKNGNITYGLKAKDLIEGILKASELKIDKVRVANSIREKFSNEYCAYLLENEYKFLAELK
jgi:teichuronic acid biosynthesis glycosyltransferase TuaC